MSLQNIGLQYLRQALDDPNAAFREGQWEAIEALVKDKARLLVVERTGWGKSLVYFIATRLLRESGFGPTLLVSPLLSLMRNQMEMANRLGVNAQSINSGNQEEWPDIIRRIADDKVDILLISPERIGNEEFMKNVMPLIAGKNGLFAVDEAHCISDWGHDFRPDYMRISRILRGFPPGSPALAVTATANDRVVEDIVFHLGEGLKVIRGPLNRESIRLQNILMPSQAERLAWLADILPQLPGCGIIYTLTVSDSERVADWLRSKGHNVVAYHAGERNQGEDRSIIERRLLRNEVKALAATVALGMGFDKPDIGFVIHFQRPPSLIHYYQQVGRAGRAMDTAYGVLLGGREDDDIADYFLRTAFPPEEHVMETLSIIEKAENGMTEYELMNQVNLRKSVLDKIIKILTIQQPAPIIKTDGRYYRTAAEWKPDTDKIERLKKIRLLEQSRIREYMQTTSCLMEFLEKELNDPHAEACGVCANCTGKPLFPLVPSKENILEAIAFLRRCDDPIRPRGQWPPSLSQEREGYKGRIPADQKAEEGRALCMWGDAGWGELVRQGKIRHGRFANELVDAMAELIQSRWKPDPPPAWITCVPSLNKPLLVPEFAMKLAAKMELPFSPCLVKVRDTPMQKEMANSNFRTKNIIDAFEVNTEAILPGPVLLVDDMVDSGWTFTVLARLLRLAGVERVFPVALARVIGD